jgi:hypothetical protein
MADFDVSGSFGADVSKFNAGMQSAGASAQGMANQAKAAADKVVGSFANIRLDTYKPFDVVATGMSGAGRAAQSLAQEFAKVDEAASGHGTGIAFYAREVHALMDEFSSGRLQQFQGTLINLAYTFLQSHVAMIPFAAAVAALGLTLGYIVVRAIEAKNAVDQVRLAMALGGVADPGTEAINKMIESLEKLSGQSYDTASKTIAQFANMKGASLPLMEGLTAGVVDFARATGQELPDAAVVLRRAFEDPAAGAKQLQGIIGGITGEQIAYVEQAQRSGSATAAQAALLRVLSEAMAAATTELRNRKVALQASNEEQARFAVTVSEAPGLEEVFTESLRRQVEQIDQRTAALRRSAEAVRSMPAARLDIQAGADAARQINPLETQLEAAQGRVRALENGIRALQTQWAQGPSGEAETRIFNQLDSQNRALRDAEAEVRRLNVALGNTESYDTRIAKINAVALAEKRDAVEVAQERIAADQMSLSIETRTADDRRRLSTLLAQHQAELRKAQADLDAANAGVEIANAGKVSEAVLAARLKQIAAQRVAAGQDRAEQARLQAEEIQARATAEDAKDQVTRQAAEERLTIETNSIRQREQAIRESANQGQTTRSNELSELMAFSREREVIERQYLTTVLGTYEEGTVEYDRYQRQLSSLASRYGTERAQTERQVGQQVYQSWNQSFQQVGSSVSTQIMGMIRHTTTFRQAVANVALDIVGQFVSAGVKMVASWAAGQATMLAATITGSSARAAAETAGQAGSLASTLATALAQINAGVAATIAGVSANQALIVGPAAPAEGAAAGAAVSAEAHAALATGLAVGTWNVPADMLANIHQGEIVVPRFEAEEFRERTGGSGGDTHLHFPGVMDTRGFLAAIKAHDSDIAKTLMRTLSNQRSARARF